MSSKCLSFFVSENILFKGHGKIFISVAFIEFILELDPMKTKGVEKALH